MARSALLLLLFSFLLLPAVSPRLLSATPSLLPQRGGDDALSDAEIDQLREAAYLPSERIGVFMKLLDSRSRGLQDLSAKPRRPGREQDLHDLFDQFTSIADELSDNLDDYGTRHRDLRKQLPKLLQATDRWATAMRTPADNDEYNLARKLALESIADIREQATHLVDEQHAYFLAHPEAAKADKQAIEGGGGRPVK